MDYKVIVTQSAQRDLEEVMTYLSVSLGNPAAARKLYAEVEECYDQLRRYPLSCECCRLPRLAEKGYRKAVIDHYILIYRPEEERGAVFVLRFFYGRQDYEKML